jgi:hypothetical protein
LKYDAPAFSPPTLPPLRWLSTGPGVLGHVGGVRIEVHERGDHERRDWGASRRAQALLPAAVGPGAVSTEPEPKENQAPGPGNEHKDGGRVGEKQGATQITSLPPGAALTALLTSSRPCALYSTNTNPNQVDASRAFGLPPLGAGGRTTMNAIHPAAHSGAGRAVVYARYSSEHQCEASIEDQVRTCKARIEAEGWTLIATYSDYAQSGASHLRPGYQRLHAEPGAGCDAGPASLQGPRLQPR